MSDFTCEYPRHQRHSHPLLDLSKKLTARVFARRRRAHTRAASVRWRSHRAAPDCIPKQHYSHV